MEVEIYKTSDKPPYYFLTVIEEAGLEIFVLTVAGKCCLHHFGNKLTTKSLEVIKEGSFPSSWLDILVVTGITQQRILNAIPRISSCTTYNLRPDFE